MRYEIRPLEVWTGPLTPEHQRRRAYTFRAPWTDTLHLLGHETDRLGAHVVVVQVDVVAGDIRRDGMLRAAARVEFPGVRVSFDSRHGPLTYATDTYDGWQANVRAIALALQALRAVDRYGVSKSGEQYRGWAAIEAGPAAGMTADEAARLLAAHSGLPTTEILDSAEKRRRAYRRAATQHHPDVGGDPALFGRLTAARELLDRYDQLTGSPR